GYWLTQATFLAFSFRQILNLLAAGNILGPLYTTTDLPMSSSASCLAALSAVGVVGPQLVICSLSQSPVDCNSASLPLDTKPRGSSSCTMASRKKNDDIRGWMPLGIVYSICCLALACSASLPPAAITTI